MVAGVFSACMALFNGIDRCTSRAEAELNGALGALRAIVDSLQDFEPRQRRASY